MWRTTRIFCRCCSAPPSGARKHDTETGQRFDAELAVAYDKLGLRESFVSKVETHITERRVAATSQDGPFRNLKTQWTITPAVQGCDVSIDN